MEELEAEGRLVHSLNGVPRLKRYVDDGQGVRLQDIWTDVNALGAHSKERTGYETQKPVALLARIIEASSNPGDLVIDPFGGTGTTAVAAEMVGRSWAVADRSLLASALTLSRVRSIQPSAPIVLRGFPATERRARELLSVDPTEFAVWATAMLSTLLDNARTTSTLAVGSRSGGTTHATLCSWVPLSQDVEPPTQLKSGAGDRHVVLETPTGQEVLSAHLSQLGASNVATIPLDQVVARESLRRGGVTAVLA